MNIDFCSLEENGRFEPKGIPAIMMISAYLVIQMLAIKILNPRREDSYKFDRCGVTLAQKKTVLTVAIGASALLVIWKGIFRYCTPSVSSII